MYKSKLDSGTSFKRYRFSDNVFVVLIRNFKNKKRPVIAMEDANLK